MLAVFVAYNDVGSGPQTHANTTLYADDGGIASGLLKDVDSGAETPVLLSTNKSSAQVLFTNWGVNPSPDTDAADVFAGFVDFYRNGSAVELTGANSYTYQFSSLERGSLYEFAGTAVLGSSSWKDRWTLVSLVGADAYTPAHSSGVGIVTHADAPAYVAENEVALWTGANNLADQGFIVQWVGINGGDDDQFEIVSRQYTGPIPTSVDPTGIADGSKGYALNGIRLLKVDPTDPPTLVNTPATNITTSAAEIGGAVVDTGGEAPNVKIYYGTTDGDTNPNAWDAWVDLGPKPGTFSHVLSGLDHGTTYYFRGFAENSVGPAWAPATASFTTVPITLASVVNLPATDIGKYSAELHGEVIDLGNDTPEVTIYYGPNDGGTDPAAWADSIDLGEQTSLFSSAIADLNHSTTYYYRAAAENMIGLAWAPTTALFNTVLITPASVVNVPATRVGVLSAQLNGEVVDTGNDFPVVTVYYGRQDGGFDPGAWEASVDLGVRDGRFATVVSGLQPETTYYFTAWAENMAGASWATPSLSFDTVKFPLLRINEFMASNNATLLTRVRSSANDPFTGDYLSPDWIEIHNTTGSTVNLNGYHLTDEASSPTRWTFPAGSLILPGGYLVVFASGRDIVNPALDESGRLHTNFSLSQAGEYLGLVDPTGQLVHEYAPEYPAQRQDVSYGIEVDLPGRFFLQPTPGGPNLSGVIDFVADTKFDADRGFYESEFDLTITTDTLDATIYYTLDGSQPTEASGTPYTGPIRIDSTTTLRAVAFKPQYEPSNVDTQTYIFLDQVIRQPRDPWGIDGYHPTGIDDYWPAQWVDRNGTSVPANYQVDPDVVFDTRYAATIKDDLRAIPTISIVTDQEHLWDPATGIYANPGGEGILWERPTSVEWINPDGTTGFQVDAGLRIQGGASRGINNKKHSFRLLFKEDYGPTRLHFPLFGDDAVDEFDTVTLRAGFNDNWPNNWNATYLQDRWAAETQLAAGGTASHGTFVHLYVNGLYWGLYNPVERPDDAFAASYLGGEKEDYDVYSIEGLKEGNSAGWDQLWALVTASPVNFAAVEQLLDVPAFIDYLIINQYGGNWDWPQNNWWATYNRADPEGKWRFHSWDAEGCLWDLNANRVTQTGSRLGQIYQQLRAVDEFKLQFADRVQRHLFNDGILTAEANLARLDAMASVIDRAIVGESARWGDGYSDGGGPRNRDDHWVPRLDWLRNTYFPGRGNIVLQQFRSAGLYPLTNAPVFQVNGASQHGGVLDNGDLLTIADTPNTVYYTLDGSDPRAADGSVSPTAVEYDFTPITLTDSSLVRSRARDGSEDGSEWSALSEARFFVNTPAAADNLAISEINYHPFDPTEAELATQLPLDVDFVAGDFEFIELVNTTDDLAVDLYGVLLAGGISFDSSVSSVTTLVPHEHVVVVKNLDAFEARYGTAINVAGQFSGELEDAGGAITLRDGAGQLVYDFSYGDSGSWPGRADGGGSSLELIDPDGTAAVDYDDGDSWRSSSEYGGTPGWAGAGPLGDVVINEVLTHTDLPDVDAIELFNTSGEAIDIGGWWLSDASDSYFKFTTAGDAMLPAGGYRVFDEYDFNPTGLDGDPTTDDPNDFALNSGAGDEVWLLAADGSGRPARFVDHVAFGAAANGESFGRWPDGSGELYPMASLTLGDVDEDPRLGALNSGPRIGPQLISEIMYHPPDPDGGGPIDADDLEFIELYNATALPVELSQSYFVGTAWQHYGWRLEGYEFPVGTTLDAGKGLVVVRFDPVTEPGKAATFRAHYGLPTFFPLLGGYDGKLDNAGETVRLTRPDTPFLDDDGQTYVTPYVLVDEVIYDDQSPWPTSADGSGDALSRRAADAWGNAATSWTSAAPSPGSWVHVTARHVFYNRSVFDGDDAAANAADCGAIAGDKSALLPEQKATLANYTSYSRGINGIMVDIAGLDDGVHLDATNDFIFRVGNDSYPYGWTQLSGVDLPSVMVFPGAGTPDAPGGPADRVTLIWPDNVIQNQWLQVTVQPTDNTGLSTREVFYFGNAIGESGDSDKHALVTAADEIAARYNPLVFGQAEVTNLYDFDRNGQVTTVDQIIARQNVRVFDALRLITVPEVLPPAPAGPATGLSTTPPVASARSAPRLDTGTAKAEDDIFRLDATTQPTAHDAVLAAGAGQETGSLEANLAKIAWLYDIEQFRAGGASAEQEDADRPAVDEALLALWSQPAGGHNAPR